MVKIVEYQGKKASIKSIFIAPDVTLIGNVLLEEKTSVWFGSILKGDTSEVFINRGTQILEHSYVENSKIGNDCLLSHKVIVHHAIVGNNVLIGMNSGIYNDAVVGSNCIIGAGTLILPNRKIPDDSVVIGNPGKILRKINEKDLDNIKKSVQNVSEKAKIIKKEF